MSIYLLPLGDSLTDPAFFTQDIRDYLAAEQELLLRIAAPYDTVIEAGCTKGRYAPLFSGKKYIGIDIAPHHIEEAQRTFADATFFCRDINGLEEILTEAQPVGKSLLLFPFNAFGNLEDAEGMLELVVSLEQPFVIFTYATDEWATKTRAVYYSSAGFDDIKQQDGNEGVRFTDSSGLNSMAYSELWFRVLFSRLGMECKVMPFGQIGVAYMNF